MARAKSNRPKDCPYVGKGGLKLRYALEYFHISVSEKVVIDLGSHVGGSTDCLLQKGARQVFAVDTGFGILAWKLRTDPRVVVCERTNALYWQPPTPVQFVFSDLGWTRQQLALPAIASMLVVGGQALSLVKPPYELGTRIGRGGMVSNEQLPAILDQVRANCPAQLEIAGIVESAYRGNAGNREFWLYVVLRSD